MTTPIPEPRRKLNQYLRKTPPTPLKTWPTRWVTASLVVCMLVTPRSSSEMANMPIIAGMKLTPCISSTEPKVKRGNPAAGSMPMVPRPSPRKSEAKPFTGSLVARKTAQVRPRAASQKYSKLEKASANSASAGAASTRMATPISPPRAEVTRFVPRLRSSCPFLPIR